MSYIGNEHTNTLPYLILRWSSRLGLLISLDVVFVVLFHKYTWGCMFIHSSISVLVSLCSLDTYHWFRRIIVLDGYLLFLPFRLPKDCLVPTFRSFDDCPKVSFHVDRPDSCLEVLVKRWRLNAHSQSHLTWGTWQFWLFHVGGTSCFVRDSSLTTCILRFNSSYVCYSRFLSCIGSKTKVPFVSTLFPNTRLPNKPYPRFLILSPRSLHLLL